MDPASSGSQSRRSLFPIVENKIETQSHQASIPPARSGKSKICGLLCRFRVWLRALNATSPLTLLATQ